MIQPETQGPSRLRQRDTEAAGSSSPRFSSTPDLDVSGSSARRTLHLWGVLERETIVSNLQGGDVFVPVKIFVSFGRKLAPRMTLDGSVFFRGIWVQRRFPHRLCRL